MIGGKICRIDEAEEPSEIIWKHIDTNLLKRFVLLPIRLSKFMRSKHVYVVTFDCFSEFFFDLLEFLPTLSNPRGFRPTSLFHLRKTRGIVCSTDVHVDVLQVLL